MSISPSGLVSDAAGSGAKKLGETAVNRAVNGLIDFVLKKFGESKVYIGTAFDRYLDNARIRYNQVKTLATGVSPRKIIGENSIYEEINLTYKHKEISTHSASSILSISRNVLIQGTGGVGKSMLMRYLFLEAASSGDYIPVLLELRRISNQQKQSVSIMELIYDCLSDFDVDLDRDQFEYSLRSGQYLFLLDGFDEIKDDLSKEAAAAIQTFCSKYSDNPCIVTTRPRQNTAPLETFTVMDSMPLTKSQAISLASRIWEEDEKTREFCRQLDETLYKKHQDFAENPLLLSMMFLTFMRNSSIPDHLADFYRQSYEALYSKHDSNNKGYFRRDFKCKDMDECDFTLLFSHFCFKTYFPEVYEFSEESILSYINKSIAKLREQGNLQTIEIDPKDYLADLIDSVCMIIRDGTIYRFSHRTFQAYFAAYYTAKHLSDEKQKRLLTDQLSGRTAYFQNYDYYELTYQLEGEIFSVNALEDKLREIIAECENKTDPEKFLLRSIISGISPDDIGDRLTYIIARDRKGHCYSFNVLELFFDHHMDNKKEEKKSERKRIFEILKKYHDLTYDGMHVLNKDVPLYKIDRSNVITKQEKAEVYSYLYKTFFINDLQSAIRRWLSKLDEQRKTLSEPNYFDEL